MNVSCPDCRSVFRVDPRKVPERGIRARCSACGGVLAIARGGSIDEEFARIGEGSTAPAFATYGSFFSQSGSAAAVPSSGAAGSSRPDSAPSGVRPVRNRSVTPAGAPLVPPAAAHRLSPAASQAGVRTPDGHPAAPSAPVPARPTTPIANAASAPGERESGSSPNQSTTREPASDVSSLSPPPASEFGRQGSGGQRARAGNPFMSTDPNLKARRLARVLVSDMVIYNPDRRAEGLRDGTLKTLFREEIKKSYEEYMEQVGRELAESTAHFQEALNEILAGGRRVF